ncbi:MAG: hypothetical protein ACKOEI_07700, partial [Chthoniobacterales bacterium]
MELWRRVDDLQLYLDRAADTTADKCASFESKLVGRRILIVTVGVDNGGKALPVAVGLPETPESSVLRIADQIVFQRVSSALESLQCDLRGSSTHDTHGDDEDSTSDEFTFRARSLGGSGVSSPIKVKLQIVDAPPQLQVTPRADFSAVAGESDRQQ